jgi:hypothetical protein
MGLDGCFQLAWRMHQVRHMYAADALGRLGRRIAMRRNRIYRTVLGARKVETGLSLRKFVWRHRDQA